MSADRNLLKEHGFGPHPKTPIPIQGLVNDELFEGLAVLGHAEDLVFVPLVVPVFPKEDIHLDGNPVTQIKISTNYFVFSM